MNTATHSVEVPSPQAFAAPKCCPFPCAPRYGSNEVPPVGRGHQAVRRAGDHPALYPNKEWWFIPRMNHGGFPARPSVTKSKTRVGVYLLTDSPLCNQTPADRRTDCERISRVFLQSIEYAFRHRHTDLHNSP